MHLPALLVVIVTNCLLISLVVMFVITSSHVVLFFTGIVYRKMSLISRLRLNLREYKSWNMGHSGHVWSSVGHDGQFWVRSRWWAINREVAYYYSTVLTGWQVLWQNDCDLVEVTLDLDVNTTTTSHCSTAIQQQQHHHHHYYYHHHHQQQQQQQQCHHHTNRSTWTFFTSATTTVDCWELKGCLVERFWQCCRRDFTGRSWCLN